MSTTDTVTRSTAANQDEELISRYSFGERVNHWVGALSYTFALLTGLAFWSPYLYWLAAIVGGIVMMYAYVFPHLIPHGLTFVR